MIQQASGGSRADSRIPVWRRVTALASLGSLVVLVGIALAAIIASGALLLLFVLDRAIAG